MTDHPPLPDFGDELALYRLVRWAKARVLVSARSPAERVAIVAEIERQYRAALGIEVAERRAGSGLRTDDGRSLALCVIPAGYGRASPETLRRTVNEPKWLAGDKLN